MASPEKSEPVAKKARVDDDQVYVFESTLEICTSNFEVEKTADLVDTFDDMPSFEGLDVTDYPYCVTETRGPKYKDNWCEARENMAAEDIEIIFLAKSKSEAVHVCNNRIRECNKATMDQLIELVFNTECFLVDAFELIHEEYGDFYMTADEEERIKEIGDTIKEEEWCEMMSYEDWKKMILHFFEQMLEVLNTPERAEASLKTAQEVYESIILNE